MDDQTVKSDATILKIPEQTFIDEYLGVDVYLREDKHLGMKVGQLEMEFKLSSDESELVMRNRYSGISKLLKDKFESEWYKTVWKPDESFLTFSLCLPDHPVVLRPDVAQKIMPGQVVSAYCSIPLSIELAVNGSRLGEYPIMVLSKTWFGEPDEGVMGYALKGQVLSSLDKLAQSLINAVCTIEIENRSLDLLCFDRLCLRTEYMGLFKSAKKFGLDTSRCRLIYTGKDRMSKINYLNPSDKTVKVIRPPRVKQGQNLFFKSFKTV